jgi:CubicO group peptidase (beta-lactamase class C family)
MIRHAVAFVALAMPSLAAADNFPVDRVAAVIEEAKFDGDVAISTRSDAPPQSTPRFSHVGALPEPWRGGDDGLTWRWASVTKQMIAILVMRAVERGTIELDQPVATYLPAFDSPNAKAATIRNLLQHRAGLPNPEADDGAFYRADYTGSRDPVTGFCAGPVNGEPGGSWSYNNCDYMVLGAVLEAVSGLAWDRLFARDIAQPLGLDNVGAYPGEQYTRRGFIGNEREPETDLSTYGASAGLYGDARALIAIDNALMRGDLLGPEALAEMWNGDPALGYMALGQWVFTVPLKGCADPVRIVERRGAIGAVEVRNFILPDRQTAVVAFAQSKPFEFGEVWMGSGFSHDLLSAAVCPQEQ